jgi:hypothetical protein
MNMRRAGHGRNDRHAYNTLVSKPERKRPLGRARHRQEYNIKMESVDWIHLLQDRN